LKYIMVNENTLCYRESNDQLLAVIVASNASDRPLGRGPIFVTELDVVRAATKDDFDRLCVSNVRHLLPTPAEAHNLQNRAAEA
jgi:hypothetical protein